MSFLSNHVFFVPDLYRGQVFKKGQSKEAWRAAVREGGRKRWREEGRRGVQGSDIVSWR